MTTIRTIPLLFCLLAVSSRGFDVAPPLPSDSGASLISESHYGDGPSIGNVVGTEHVRTMTNWFGGTARKVATTNVIYLGTSVPVLIYEQRGQISVGHVIKFPSGTNVLEHPKLDWVPTARIYRYFSMSGGQKIVLTNVLQDPLYP